MEGHTARPPKGSVDGIGAQRHSVKSHSRSAIVAVAVFAGDHLAGEGFFGRLKIEFFHGCDWAGVTLEEFMDMLAAYLRWYRDVRIKGDLDYRSPMQYRRDLGLLAA